MNYREAMEYVEEAERYGMVPGLDSIRELLVRLGRPERELKFIHIAGTNGKGSTAAFLAEILKCAGLKAGRYTSPAVFRYRERIQVDGRLVSKESFAKNLTAVRKCAEEMEREGLPHPTLFEMETAAAFLCFRQEQCDIVVLEAGLGGGEDATNVIENALAAVITPVSRDHSAILGDAPAFIARHKAGIIKPGCRVVTAPQEPEVLEVIRDTADRLSCPIYTVDRGAVAHVRSSLSGQRFDFGPYQDLEIRLAGRYQTGNAALAVRTVEALADCGISVGERGLRRGLLLTKWPGRFTVLSENPLFVIDGAHNEAAARELADSVRFYFTNRRIIYIMGVLRDKDYEAILEQTADIASEIITVTPPGNSRALPAYDLAKAAGKYRARVTAADSPEEAVELACLLAGEDAAVVAFGSLSYLGRIGQAVKNRDQMRSDPHGRQRED